MLIAWGDNGGEQFASNGIIKGVDFGPAYSSPISQAKDCLAVSPGVNKFQVLRNLMENYPCSDCDSYFVTRQFLLWWCQSFLLRYTSPLSS